jgi:hypothetical protein
MIFNINEISEKIRKKPRPKKPEITERPRRALPSLSISEKKTAKSSDTKIYEVVKSAKNKRKSIAKIAVSRYKLNKTSAKILLALLYWSNGSKYPSSNFIAFSNSDANLVKTFLNLLRSTFPIKESKIRIHLQFYKNQDIKKLIQYWSKLLEIPKVQFYKPTVTRPPKKISRSDFFGTCTIRYYSLDLLLTIMGIYEEVATII